MGNSTSAVTTDESSLLDANKDTICRFYEHPTIENYNIIKSLDSALEKSIGVERRNALMWVIRDTFDQLEDPLTGDDYFDYQILVDRLMDKRNLLTPDDLDTLWMMYYGSGDMMFPNRVKNVAQTLMQNYLTIGAAKWSYSSHINQGYFDDPDWNTE